MYKIRYFWLSSMDLAEYFALFSEYFDFVSPSVSNLPGARPPLRPSGPAGSSPRRRRPQASLKPMAKKSKYQRKVRNVSQIHNISQKKRLYLYNR